MNPTHTTHCTAGAALLLFLPAAIGALFRTFYRKLSATFVTQFLLRCSSCWRCKFLVNFFLPDSVRSETLAQCNLPFLLYCLHFCTICCYLLTYTYPLCLVCGTSVVCFEKFKVFSVRFLLGSSIQILVLPIARRKCCLSWFEGSAPQVVYTCLCRRHS